MGLNGENLDIGSHYMMPIVNVDDKVQVVEALGVISIAFVSATKEPEEVEKRFPKAKGWGSKLARPAKEVDLLVGLDNQSWMPRHLEKSLVKGDNLRLMQSVLGLACMLMGSTKGADPDNSTKGAGVRARGEPKTGRMPVGKQSRR
jgi:hypothetical protein